MRRIFHIFATESQEINDKTHEKKHCWWKNQDIMC